VRRAAIFDLDRTLVRVNTAALFVRSQVKRGEARRRDLAKTLMYLARYTFGALDAVAIVRRVALGMKGVDEAKFRARMDAWVASDVLEHLTDSARSEVERRRAAGDLCVVLTSSTPYAAIPVATAVGIDHVLATRLEVKEGLFTGLIVDPVCYGAGKVSLAEAWARDHDVDLASSAFYTDSISDRPMLERVGEPIAVNPDPRLRLLAWRRGWRVERW
jgi:HAD superfamily hydrolase (TIGR01490 family)